MDTIKINSLKTKIIAHRGLSGIEKENTHSAFTAAGNRSYHGIETDVHKTIDGRFVCIHDDTTERVAIDNLTVEKTTFETLRRLSLCDTFGRKGREDLRIPTLAEYIRICRQYEKTAVLELKNSFEAEDIKAICEEIKTENWFENVIFISFVFDNLVKLRELFPEHTVQFLTDKYTDLLPDILSEHRFDLDIKYTELQPERIAELHKRGIKINCWTCNDPYAAENLCKNEVEYITTNILE